MQLIKLIPVFLVFTQLLWAQNEGQPLNEKAISLAKNAFSKTDSILNHSIDEIEVDILSSYYEQDGEHSAVEGGEGTQYLNDIVSMIVINVPFLENNVINMSLGLDVYTSASTAMIDNQASGASFKDERAYGNLSYTRLNDKIGDLTIGGGFSKEWDVSSVNYNVGWNYTDPYKNYSFGLKTIGVFDNWELIYPTEFRSDFNNPSIGGGLQDDVRKTFGGSLLYSQVLSKTFQFSLNYDFTAQYGLLSTPFHRVFSDTTQATVQLFGTAIPISDLDQEVWIDLIDKDIERLPSQRLKHALALRTSWHISNTFLLRTFVRGYSDDFGIQGFTGSVEVPIKFNRFISFAPFWRYYEQSESKYFKPIFSHNLSQEYYTSDYDLSAFSAVKYGAGLHISPPFGVFSTKGIASQRSLMLKNINVRYAHYSRTDGLSAYIVSVGLGFVF